MGGTCFAAKEMIDYLVSDMEWDIATFEIGVNIRSNFTPEENEKRLRYLLEIMKSKKKEKPVYLITMFPNWNSHWILETNVIYEHELIFNEVIKKLYQELKRENLYLVEGNELL